MWVIDIGRNLKFDEVCVVVNIEDINDNWLVFIVCLDEVIVEENKLRGERVI